MKTLSPKAFATLRAARQMQEALGYLLVAHVETSDVRLPDAQASGVQTLQWHIGDTLAQTLWHLALERQAGPPAIHTHGTELDCLATLAQLMSTALRKELGGDGDGREIGPGLSRLVAHFTQLVEEEQLKDSDQHQACWLLLQRLAGGEDVDRAEFEAVGIKPAKGGAR